MGFFQRQFLIRPLVGGFAFLVAIGQGLLAAGLLFGPGRWMVRFGIALNASVVLASVATRFVGNPGFLGFDRLPVEALNLTATAWQVAPLLLLFTIGREPGSARWLARELKSGAYPETTKENTREREI